MRFQTVKGRTLTNNQVVEVYFNLHKKMYSIRDKKTGLVVAHADSVSLYDAKFKVSEAGRQRVIREQRKNVHAYVEGQFVGAAVNLPNPEQAQQSYYNPYKTDSFIDRHTGRKLIGAEFVHCQDKQAYFVNGVYA